MASMIKEIKNEYLYRDIWINRCNDNYFSNFDTDFHLVIPVDEINERCEHVEVLPSQLTTGKNNEQKRQ
jgi:hypothetical protein